MFSFRYHPLAFLTLLILPAGMVQAQTQVAPGVAPTPTIWSFMGIPQGIQRVRDVASNRRGNFPGLERRPPLTRIADPANLVSSNPAIKAAAEIKQAEDMKQQKIKAIKFLATIGCGCYDKDGKVTEALLAATDDCTPEVRMAAVEAIGEAANGECCRSCGSKSCCNEKITKRLSEMAYERDDSGCPIEPSAEIRCEAKRVLCKCCPGGPPSGPIEEDIVEEEASEDLPKPPADEDSKKDEPAIKGETSDEDAIKGEGSDASASEPDSGEAEEASNEPAENGEDTNDESAEGAEAAAEDAAESADSDEAMLVPSPVHVEVPNLTNEQKEQEQAELLLRHALLSSSIETNVGEVKMIGGMAVQPITISPTRVKAVTFREPASVSKVTSTIPMSMLDPMQMADGLSSPQTMLE